MESWFGGSREFGDAFDSSSAISRSGSGHVYDISSMIPLTTSPSMTPQISNSLVNPVARSVLRP